MSFWRWKSNASEKPLNPNPDYPSDPSGSDVEHPVSRRARAKASARNSFFSEVFGKLFWLAFCALAAFVIWQVGPRLVENYQFAVTKGKIRAEYQNAADFLEGDPLRDISKAYQLVAQRIRPSVVSIKCEKTIIREGRRPTRGEGQGSGVVMASNGYILTNAHVINRGSNIVVTLYDKRQFAADVVGVDELTDLAVLKIDAQELITADWGDSDALEVGSPVWAIGSPFGLEYTVTSGIVSGKNRVEQKPTPGGDGRPKSPHQELLQTDAAVNPGNSGGPLVDSTGAVIGINSSIVGEQFLGISFAIPSSIAKFVFEELAAKGVINRGYFGFDPDPVYQMDADRLGLPDLKGALVGMVQDNSPAQIAGILPGDVIRAWNGKSITDHSILFRYSLLTPPRTRVELTVFRNGHEQRKMLTVGQR